MVAHDGVVVARDGVVVARSDVLSYGPHGQNVYVTKNSVKVLQNSYLSAVLSISENFLMLLIATDLL